MPISKLNFDFCLLVGIKHPTTAVACNVNKKPWFPVHKVGTIKNASAVLEQCCNKTSSEIFHDLMILMPVQKSFSLVKTLVSNSFSHLQSKESVKINPSWLNYGDKKCPILMYIPLKNHNMFGLADRNRNTIVSSKAY